MTALIVGGVPCPTCQGRNRETTDMVCMTCGRDWLDDHPAPGYGWKRLMEGWQARADDLAAELAEVENERDSLAYVRPLLADWIARAEAAEARATAAEAERDELKAAITCCSRNAAAVAAVRALCDSADRWKGSRGIAPRMIRAALDSAGDRPAEGGGA